MNPRRRDDVLRSLSEADRAYRAAFRKLTSRGGRTGSTLTSFEELVAATEDLQAAARELLLHRDDTGRDDGGHPPPAEPRG